VESFEEINPVIADRGGRTAMICGIYMLIIFVHKDQSYGNMIIRTKSKTMI